MLRKARTAETRDTRSVACRPLDNDWMDFFDLGTVSIYIYTDALNPVTAIVLASTHYSYEHLISTLSPHYGLQLASRVEVSTLTLNRGGTGLTQPDGFVSFRDFVSRSMAASIPSNKEALNNEIKAVSQPDTPLPKCYG